MDAYADKNYLHAKIYALYDNLLKKTDYSEIINSKNLLSILPASEPSLNTSDHIKIKETIFRNQITKLSQKFELYSL